MTLAGVAAVAGYSLSRAASSDIAPGIPRVNRYRGDAPAA